MPPKSSLSRVVLRAAAPRASARKTHTGTNPSNLKMFEAHTHAQHMASVQCVRRAAVCSFKDVLHVHSHHTSRLRWFEVKLLK